MLIESPVTVSVLGTDVNLRYNAALISALLFILAALLYMAMLVAYDTLLMPTRFRAERSVASRPSWLVARPPSSSSYVL